MNTNYSTHVGVAIVGSGFGGLGLAIRLKQAGRRDFTVFERAMDVGGTWRDNSYPGCACDVESLLYSFSFAQNPAWSRMYSPQPEIQAYLQDCARRFDVLPHIRFGHDVAAAAWDDAAQLWRLTTSHGAFTADVLVSAMGPLSDPAIPRLPGIETFTGKVFHSARWDHAYPLAGKRVAVVGTGASAIQFVPQIQPQVAQLTLFQRTPAWVLPRLDRPLTPKEHRLYKRFPLAQKLRRLKIFIQRETYGFSFRHPKYLKTAQFVATRHLQRAVTDPVLREKLSPPYQIGCKRVLISNDYYPALAQPNVEVVTDGIKEIRAASIVTSDGRERPIDAIIYGTGFHVTDAPYARQIRGRDGRSLAEIWQGSPRGHLGTTVAGFPNLFILHGPNTGLGHSSVVMMLEAQIAHIMRALRYMRRKRLATLEPTPRAQAAFNDEIAARTNGTVWAAGCASWYLDRSGYNSVLWPSSVPAFRWRVEPFRAGEYTATRRQERVS